MGFSQLRNRSTPARRGDTIPPVPNTQETVSDDRLPLIFGGRLVIVGGGSVETDLLRSVAKDAEGLVGADSGADTIMAAGLVPNAVIGDMDSVADRAGFPAGTRVIPLAEQDTTDFEKCLYSTRAPITVAIGMTGGRFDHTLAALHAVARHAASRRIVLLDEHDLALGVSGSLRFAMRPGERVSIYPLGRTEFSSSTGLLYPLEGLVMEQGSSIGTSNAATADIVTINVATGPQSPWLLILDRNLLETIL